MSEDSRKDRLLVQAKLPADLVKQVDHMAIEWGTYRGPAVERLLREALGRYPAYHWGQEEEEHHG